MRIFLRKIILGYGVIFLLFVIDRLVKHWLVSSEDHERTGLIVLSKNQGVAFGIPISGLIFYILLFLILLGSTYLALKYLKKKRTSLHLAVVLIFVGALSNLIDRFKFGAVIDYLDIRVWPAFNLADVMIVVGVGAWVIDSMLKKNDEN